MGALIVYVRHSSWSDAGMRTRSASLRHAPRDLATDSSTRSRQENRRPAQRGVGEREWAPSSTSVAANAPAHRPAAGAGQIARRLTASVHRSAPMLGAKQRECVLDALLEDVVGELPVGQGAGDLERPDHQGEDTERLQAR